MSSHYVAVLEGVPHCNHGGGGITAYAAVKAMRERGNRVTVIALGADPKTGNDAKHIGELSALGIETILSTGDEFIPKRAGVLNTLFPSGKDVFPGLASRGRIRALLAKLRPNAIFMYHWNALAAVHGIREYPKFGTVGDPAHMPFQFRSSLLEAYRSTQTWKSGTRSFLTHLGTVPKMVRLQNEFLRDCHARGAFAAHHAEMFSRTAGVECLYLQTPTPDPHTSRLPRKAGEKFRIMHIGHLLGIATLAGVELLAKETLPELIRLFPPDSFEIHLVGGFFETMPKELQQAMQDKHIKIRGQVTPADAEFLASDLLLVPTPIELGIRVRILTAFSFGTCVVAHVANQKGIPEMKDGANSLMGSNGAELSRHCKRLFDQPELKERIGNAARQTYESGFSLDVAGGRICGIMDRLAGAMNPAAVTR